MVKTIFFNITVNIREEFISYIDVTGSITGKALADTVQDEIGKLGLDMNNARGFCADGAGMSVISAF